MTRAADFAAGYCTANTGVLESVLPIHPVVSAMELCSTESNRAVVAALFAFAMNFAALEWLSDSSNSTFALDLGSHFPS